MTKNKLCDPKVPENIISLKVVYEETFTAATRHNTSCSEDKYFLNALMRQSMDMERQTG